MVSKSLSSPSGRALRVSAGSILPVLCVNLNLKAFLF